ncbi:MAG: hypothetical protein KDI12_02130 [Anaerolineae bacterium]|nr:hypothetical protein [Anaerolineae bacterium]
MTFRTAGIALLAVCILFMIGASVAAYFRRFPIPTDPLEQLTLIANDRAGWTAQAVIFPVCFLAFTIIFGWMAARLPAGSARWLAIAAALAAGAALLLWLPISADRLRLAARAAEMIAAYDPTAPSEVFRDTGTFWPYTFCALASVALLGAALALAGVLPVLGWIVAALALVGALTGTFVMHDWPPFLSYVILMVLSIGLIRAG